MNIAYKAHKVIYGENRKRYKTDQLWSTALFTPFKELVDAGINRKEVDKIIF